MKRLIYKLELPEHWKIYFVVTVAILEPATAPDQDFYKRKRFIKLSTFDAADKQYEIDKLLFKRVYRNNRRPKYLVRWKGYKPKNDL